MEPETVIREARKAIAEADHEFPVTELKTLRQIVSTHTARPRFYMTLFSAFAGIALILAAVGIYGVVAAGLAASLYLTRFISSFLYGVQATDTATLLSVSILLLLIVGFACYLPARRASRLDPVIALRHA